MPRGNQREPRLTQVDIQPARSGGGGFAQIRQFRGGVPRGADDEFKSLSRIAGKLGKKSKEKEELREIQAAEDFLHAVPGETPEGRSRRITEEFAKLAKKHPDLDITQFGTFHKKLSEYEGAVLVGRVEDRVRVRKAELTDHLGDDGLLQTPDFAAVWAEEVQRIEEESGRVVGNAFAANVFYPGLERRMDVVKREFGRELSANTESHASALWQEGAAADATRIATLISNDGTDAEVSAEFTDIGKNMFPEDGQALVPRDARGSYIAGFLAQITRMANSQELGQGPVAALDALEALEQHLSIGGVRVGRDDDPNKRVPKSATDIESLKDGLLEMVDAQQDTANQRKLRDMAVARGSAQNDASQYLSDAIQETGAVPSLQSVLDWAAAREGIPENAKGIYLDAARSMWNAWSVPRTDSAWSTKFQTLLITDPEAANDMLSVVLSDPAQRLVAGDDLAKLNKQVVAARNTTRLVNQSSWGALSADLRDPAIDYGNAVMTNQERALANEEVDAISRMVHDFAAGTEGKPPPTPGDITKFAEPLIKALQEKRDARRELATKANDAATEAIGETLNRGLPVTAATEELMRAAGWPQDRITGAMVESRQHILNFGQVGREHTDALYDYAEDLLTGDDAPPLGTQEEKALRKRLHEAIDAGVAAKMVALQNDQSINSASVMNDWVDSFKGLKRDLVDPEFPEKGAEPPVSEGKGFSASVPPPVPEDAAKGAAVREARESERSQVSAKRLTDEKNADNRVALRRVRMVEVGVPLEVRNMMDDFHRGWWVASGRSTPSRSNMLYHLVQSQDPNNPVSLVKQMALTTGIAPSSIISGRVLAPQLDDAGRAKLAAARTEWIEEVIAKAPRGKHGYSLEGAVGVSEDFQVRLTAWKAHGGGPSPVERLNDLSLSQFMRRAMPNSVWTAPASRADQERRGASSLDGIDYTLLAEFPLSPDELKKHKWEITLDLAAYEEYAGESHTKVWKRVRENDALLDQVAAALGVSEEETPEWAEQMTQNIMKSDTF